MKKYLINLLALYGAFGIAGVFGAHHFLRGKILLGFIYLATFGIFGLGLIFDLFAIPFYARDL